MTDAHRDLTLDEVRRLARAIRNRPAVERIFAFLEGETLAAFILQNVVAAWIVRRFPGAQVTAAFRDGPPARRFVTACNPHISRSIITGTDSPVVLPVDWFDIGTFAPVQCADPDWRARHLDQPDLVLLPGMLSADASLVAGLAEAPPALRLPTAEEAVLADGLVAAGMDRAAWFAVVDATLDAVCDGRLTRHVEERGGRALSLQPPAEADAEAAKRAAAAVARARFVIAADPLLLTVTSTFRTPCAAVGLAAGTVGRHVWNRGDLVLSGNHPDAAGQRLAVLRAIDRLLADTPACLAWRTAAPAHAAPEAAEIRLPLPLRDHPLVTCWA
jgi:hypothetical protein